MLGDLHMHSNWSDGLLSPTEVAAAAQAAGAEVVALSDHDTCAGVAEMSEACKRFGIINVPALEVTSHDGCDVHVLGYNIRPFDKDLNEFLKYMQKAREERAQIMLDRLSALGMPLTMEQVCVFARKTMSRGQVAHALVAAGYAKDIGECFEKWLYEGGPCFAPNTQATPIEAIARIHAAGGLAVLAHPVRLKKTDAEKIELIDRMAKAGLDGIEAVYKHSAPDRIALFTELAAKYKLFVTNGGDFHGRTSQILPRPLMPDTLAALGI